MTIRAGMVWVLGGEGGHLECLGGWVLVQRTGAYAGTGVDRLNPLICVTMVCLG